MSLISCYECSGEMSTAAAACPRCGAPNTPHVEADDKSYAHRKSSAAKIIGGLLAGCFVLGAAYKMTEGPEAKSPASTIVTPKEIEQPNIVQNAPQLNHSEPTAPSHNYSMSENREYGYEAALSEEDKRNGTVTKPLMMARYLGRIDGKVTVEIRDAMSRNIVSCDQPCDFVKVKTYVQGMLVNQQQIRAASGSLIAEVMDDAISGQLEPFSPPAPTAALAEQAPAPIVISSKDREVPATDERSQPDAQASN
jgi:hypothetical protein